MLRLIFSLLLLSAPLAAQIRFHPVDQSVVMQRLASAPNKNEDRQQALADMFRSVSCEPTLQLVKHTKASNVICMLPGKTDEVVIVGAHLDHVARGRGIIDDWSGAALLPTLYESLKPIEHRYTFVFVGFTEEEKGLVGSKFYVHEMSKESRAKTVAMINLECLGLATTKVWASHADKRLLQLLGAVAQGMKADINAVNVDNVGSADSESFAPAKIPRVTIHTVTQETFRLLHTDDDNMTAIHPDVYYENYRLIAAYLSALDSLFERDPTAPVSPSISAGAK